MSHHSVVWLDHNEAKIFHFLADSLAQEKVVAHAHHDVSHRLGGRNPPDNLEYYREIAAHLQQGERILVVGPASAKLELIRHLHKHHHDIEKRVVGVETVDHPSDGQLVAYAKKYFKVSDIMH